MAELLIRVVDKVNDDFYLNLKCTKQYDVIVADKNGAPWQRLDLKNDDWRIIRFPITVAQAQIYLEPQDDGKDPKDQTKSKTLLRRAVKIDLDSPLVPADLKAHISNPRVDGIFDAKTFDPTAIKVVKPTVADPNSVSILGIKQ